MPKCSQCRYLVKEKSEYSDEYCEIFGYDKPEKYVAWKDEGCRCTKKMLSKLYQEILKTEAYYTKEAFNQLQNDLKELKEYE